MHSLASMARTDCKSSRRETDGDPARPEVIPYLAEITGADQPGVLARMVRFFAERGVSIEDLHATTNRTQYSETQIGSAIFTVGLPVTLSLATVRGEFMDLCDEINVDGVLAPAQIDHRKPFHHRCEPRSPSASRHRVPPRTTGGLAAGPEHARSATIGSHRTAFGEDGEQRLFVLDTNVLMHDPTALFRFQEHDVYLPMVVLEELDAAKKGTSEIARNVREVSRILDEMVRDADEAAIRPRHRPARSELASGGPRGVPVLSDPELLRPPAPGAPGCSKPDNGILNVARALDREHPGRAVVIVSKDINLRIKARALGILAEDYRDDVVLDDVSLLYPGVYEMPPGDWDECIAAAPTGARRTGPFDAAGTAGKSPGGFPTSACTRAATSTPTREWWCAGSRTGRRCSNRFATTAPVGTRCGASTRGTSSRTSR